MLGTIILDSRSTRHKHSAKVVTNPKSKVNILEILKQHSVKCVQVELMSSDNFVKLMLANGERYDLNFTDRLATDECIDVENFINSICQPDVIRASCDIYLKALE